MSTFRNYARLFRIPNLPTCAADVIGGFFVAGGMRSVALLGDGVPGEFQGWVSLVGLILASMMLYCGGMADNDVQHVDKDRVLKSKRPIVDGDIDENRASWVAGWLFMGGIVFASLTPLTSTLTSGARWPLTFAAVLIVVLSKWYNRLAAGKTIEFTYTPPTFGANLLGVFVLAMCRVLNVAMGFFLASTTNQGIDWALLGVVSALVFAYFCVVIIASLFEDSGAKAQVAKTLMSVAVALGMLALIFPQITVGKHWVVGYQGNLFAEPAFSVYVALMSAAFGLVVAKCWRAMKAPSPRNMGMIVKWGIAGDCLMMGALTSLSWSAHAPFGLAVASLFLVCVWLGRFAKAT